MKSSIGLMPAVLTSLFLLTNGAEAGVCEKAGSVLAGVGATVAGTSTAVGMAGTAAVPHAAGGFILSSVGVGGTGYIAGTLGGIGATFLAAVSSPVLIAGAVGVTIGAGGTAAYCFLTEDPQP